VSGVGASQRQHTAVPAAADRKPMLQRRSIIGAVPPPQTEGHVEDELEDVKEVDGGPRLLGSRSDRQTDRRVMHPQEAVLVWVDGQRDVWTIWVDSLCLPDK
jgi:hypothetical protein